MSKLVHSWEKTANNPEGSFPLNNIPFGVFSYGERVRCCATAIGDYIVDLNALETLGYLRAGGVFQHPTLNAFMASGQDMWKQVRNDIIEIFKSPCDSDTRANITKQAMIPLRDCRLHLPIEIAEYTDFYAGRNHATNVGTMFRGAENALPPNWLHMPIGYNGRASTVVVSGTDITRPQGQLKGPEFDAPIFAPSRRLDIELEMGAVIGSSSNMGERISVKDADEMIFGYVLLNDWSARDIQAWEYQPLGPFQAKAFATTISPWIITQSALEPFRVSTPQREKPLLDYLMEPGPMLYDVDLEISLQPGDSKVETVISRTNFKELYYSPAQQLAHHASSGCKMNTGDLLGSGTISGSSKDEFGSLLELSWGGKEPLLLENGVTRTFLEDADTAKLCGYAKGDGFTVGFGDCVGTIRPAK